MNKIATGEPNKHINARKSKKLIERDWASLRRRLGWLPLEIIKKAFEVTTQLVKVDIRLPLKRHFKSRFLQANVNSRLKEAFSTDTFFSSIKAIGGHKCIQLFVGNKRTLMVPYGMTTESEGPTKLQDFIRDWGAPSEIFRDNSKMQNSDAWKEIKRMYLIKNLTCEPHNQQQNKAERKKFESC